MPLGESHARPVERVTWLVLGSTCLAVLALAARLEPDPRGLGTHVQLGLPPCGFHALTGLPCPGCGLTTAFAHGIRGQWVEAASANPLGLLLFVVAVATVSISVPAFWRGWRFSDVFDRLGVHRWALVVALAGIATWVARLAWVV